MAGILDILRAAVVPAAAARTGYLQGEEAKRQRTAADDDKRRQRARQTMQDQLGMQDRMRESREADEEKQRRGLIDQSRIALEKAQAEEVRARAGANRSRAGYYDRGNPRGSGPNGELTAKDKARFIGQRLQRYMEVRHDSFGDPIPGSGLNREAALQEAERDWEATTGHLRQAPPPAKPSISGMRDYVDPRMGGLTTPPPAKPTAGPLAATREAMTPAAPPAAIDSAALAKKYPYLFSPE